MPGGESRFRWIAAQESPEEARGERVAGANRFDHFDSMGGHTENVACSIWILENLDCFDCAVLNHHARYGTEQVSDLLSSRDSPELLGFVKADEHYVALTPKMKDSCGGKVFGPPQG